MVASFSTAMQKQNEKHSFVILSTERQATASIITLAEHVGNMVAFFLFRLCCAKSQLRFDTCGIRISADNDGVCFLQTAENRLRAEWQADTLAFIMYPFFIAC